MIKRIEQKIENNKLILTIETKIRPFVVHPVKILTLEEVLKLVDKSHKIIKILETPNHPVGNGVRKGIKQKGTWIFEIEKKKIRRPRAPNQKTKTLISTNKNLTKTSVRSRMSKVAKELNENRKK